MESPREITVAQTAAILISTIIGVGVLPLPLFAVRAADTGAPLVTLIAIVISFIGVWLLSALGKKYPDKTIIRYSEELLGKWLGKVGGILIIGFFAILTALAAREFGEVVITAVLRRTPLEVTVIVMLLLAVISTRNDIRTFAYIHMFYLPFLLAPVLLIVALSLKNANGINLLPVWGNEPSGMWKGSLTVAALFQGSFILSMVIPSMRHPQKVMKASIWGVGVAGGLYLLIVISTVAVFGAEEIKQLLWPTLELARTTSLPANVLERLDILFLAVWVTAVFTTLFSSYFLTIHAMSEFFRLRDHKLFSLFLLPFVFVFAMLPTNVIHMYEWIVTIGHAGLWITVIYPCVLFIVSLFRKRRSDAVADTQVEKTD